MIMEEKIWAYLLQNSKECKREKEKNIYEEKQR